MFEAIGSKERRKTLAYEAERFDVRENKIELTELASKVWILTPYWVPQLTCFCFGQEVRLDCYKFAGP